MSVQTTMQAACQARSGCGWRGRPRATHRGREVLVAAVRIRQCRLADTDQVARLCADVFAERTFAELDVPALNALDQRYAAAVQREVAVKLQEALSAKQQAALAARASRLQHQGALLRAQLAAAQGARTTWPTQGPQQRRQEASWRRARTWVCLMATNTTTTPHGPANTSTSTISSSSSSSGSGNGGSLQVSAPDALILPKSVSGQQQQQEEGAGQEGGQEVLLGCLALNLMQPEAALPPPWPSAAPWRPYLANMAVAPGARRQGVAAALLAAAERVVAAWGGEGIWLHVAEDNTPAQALYTRAGFAHVQGASGWPFSLTPIPKRQLLLSKPLPPRRDRSSSSSSSSMEAAAGSAANGQHDVELAGTATAGSSSSGSYVWQVTSEVEGAKQ